MQNSFQSLVEAANSVLVLLPSNPTLDQVASGLSLYLSLSEKKSVSIVCPTPMTVDFNKLVGVNRISDDLGNQNLVISFKNYQANDIERVSYDIEDKEFKLSVIPKAGMSAPNKDQINLTYSGVSSDLVILVGGVNESHYPSINDEGLKSAKKLHIGIRQLTFAGQYQILSFVQPFSSIAEVVANLLIQAKFKIDADISTDLIAGIEEGSSHFTTSGVAPETFQLIYELMRTGGKRVLAEEDQQGSFPPGSIPGQVPQPTQPQTAQSQMAQPQPTQIQSGQPVQPANQSPSQGGVAGIAQQSGGNVVQQPQSVTSVKTLNENSSVSEQDDQSDNGADKNGQEPPKDWLEPKIYKGSSVNKN